MINCIVSKKSLPAGVTAVCLVKGSPGTDSVDDSPYYEHSIIFAQVHGHISADFRWLKSSTKLHELFAEPSLSIDNTQFTVNDPTPLLQHHTSHCIFSTSRIALSPTHVFDQGALLEFELPGHSIPSYKGLCATVCYYLTLHIQCPTFTEVVNFPLQVHGAGSATSPYQIQHSSMVAYPATSIPTEILFSVPTIGSNQEISSDCDGARPAAPREVPNVYMIRDKDHICDLHLRSQTVAPGGDVHVHLDFVDCLQPCSQVRITVMQSETRPDGSRIQDKVVSKAIRTATDAEYLNLVLNIPSEMSGSFQTPLFQVEYRIDMDFCLDRRAIGRENNADKDRARGGGSPTPHTTAGVFDGAFSFSIPLHVQHSDTSTLPQSVESVQESNRNGPCDSNDPQAEGGVSSIAAVQLQALRCLESNIVLLPIRVHS